MKSIFSILIALLLAAQSASAIDDDGPGGRGVLATIGNDIGTVIEGAGAIYVSPLRWEGVDWVRAGLAGAAFAAAYIVDTEMRRAIVGDDRNIRNVSTPFVARFGHPLVGLGLSGGVYLSGLLSGNGWLHGTGITLFQTLTASGAMYVGMNSLFGRSRPYVTGENARFQFMSWKWDNLSLPSAHTLVAFGVASVVAARARNAVFTVALYTLAGFTAWSRLHTDVHWFSDVLMSATCATAMGIAAVNRYEGKKSGDASIELLPASSGLALVLRF